MNEKTDYHQALLPGGIYHLFSRAVGSEKLFLSEANYLYFLQRLKHDTQFVCRFYAFSLLPNHFHLLVKINDEAALIQHFEEVKNKKFEPNTHDISDFVMERFSNFLNGYTKAFNKMYQRKGALFMDYLRRSNAATDADFMSFVWYVHKNAVHHQLTKKVGDWPYDSYKTILNNKATELLSEELIERFGGREAFLEFHQQEVLPKS